MLRSPATDHDTACSVSQTRHGHRGWLAALNPPSNPSLVSRTSLARVSAAALSPSSSLRRHLPLLIPSRYSFLFRRLKFS
ncbi:hypothetical protein B296_00033482 [Ensete ventricosum]|uniref:Uncharacterized protein n=1 Tax=Ensete ventricosum TaxID=4639 RepID=A0A426Z224_ENSVE|nr:hypothetical protein B296_00033482 [Ensete ventricosum]